MTVLEFRTLFGCEQQRGEQLSGLVEVNEGHVDGEEHGKGRRGRGKLCKKLIPGFAALDAIPDVTTEALKKFLIYKAKTDSHVLSDGWYDYCRLKSNSFEHTATAAFKLDEPAHNLFPWVHITLSNLKRLLLAPPSEG